MKQQRVQGLRRIIAGDDNPLRRYVDKLESAVVASLVIAFLVAAPLVAVFAVRVVGSAGAREMRAESGWLQRPAVLATSAEAGLIGLDGEWDTSWVTAHWMMPDGIRRGGLVAVDLNAKAGQRVMVWVTPAGRPTHPRLTRAAVAERQVMAAIAAPAGLVLLLSITASTVRVLANRRRMAAWTKAWEAIGPRWSSLR
jgi:hypothetical protein